MKMYLDQKCDRETKKGLKRYYICLSGPIETLYLAYGPYTVLRHVSRGDLTSLICNFLEQNEELAVGQSFRLFYTEGRSAIESFSPEAMMRLIDLLAGEYVSREITEI